MDNTTHYFAPITSFPTVKTNCKVGLLVRLFPYADDLELPQEELVLNLALWSMRSHILNSDIRDYDVQPIFHVKEVFYPRAYKVLHRLGIPDECIISYPNELCSLNTPVRHYYYNAAAPFLDPQLETFEHIIVVDADTFSYQPVSAQSVPLLKLSLEAFPQDTITVGTTWRENADMSSLWLFYHKNDRDALAVRGAQWAECSIDEFKAIMYEFEAFKPAFDLFYINMPMSYLRSHPDFRQYIHDCSADLGHEEIAFAMWALRHYFRTGEHIPTQALFNPPVRPAYRFRIACTFADAWNKYTNLPDKPVFLHGMKMDGVMDDLFDITQALGATNEESVACVNLATNN